jgi:MFS family permease
VFGQASVFSSLYIANQDDVMLRNFFLRRLQYNQQARRFFMTIVALGFVIDGVYGVLLNLYLLRLGYDARFIGQVNSFGLLTFALVSLPAGLLGTRWAGSLMLRVGLGSILLGTFLLPLAEYSPTGWQETWFIVTYALIMTGYSLFFVNGAPFLMTVVEREKQTSAFALQTALLALAAFAGSLFGGTLPGFIADLYDFTLDSPEPYRYTMMFAALVILAAFCIALVMVKQPELNSEELPVNDVNSGYKQRTGGFTTTMIVLIGAMSLVRFLQVAGLATTSVFFNVYLDTQYAMPTSAIGIIASVSRLIAVPIVLLAPRLIKRTSTGNVAMWASLATAISLLPIALVPYWWGAAIGYISALSLTNLRFAAFIIYIMVLVPKRQQAVMVGAGEAAAGFSFAFMALAGGYLVTWVGFQQLFLLGAMLSGLGTLVFWLHLRTVNLRKGAEAGSLP